MWPWKGQKQPMSLIHQYHISSNEQPLAALCSANRFYWGQWGVSERSCPPAVSRSPPPPQRALRWLIRTPREKGIPFQQLGLPRDSSISFCLIHLYIQRTQQEHLAAKAAPNSSPEQRSCPLSFIKGSSPLVSCLCVCSVCARESHSCAICSPLRVTKSKKPAFKQLSFCKVWMWEANRRMSLRVRSFLISFWEHVQDVWESFQLNTSSSL